MIAEVYQMFVEVVTKKDKIRLMNVFRGVPVTYDAYITEMRGEEVRLRTHPFQLICIRYQKKTYIHYSNKTYRAEALSTDLKNENTLLTNFEPAHEIGLRKHVRVEPRQPTQVYIYSDQFDKNRNQWISTMMADVSIKGIAIYMNPFLFTLTAMSINDTIKLKFTLADNESGLNFSIQSDGVVRNIFRNNEKRVMRIGIEMFPDKVTESQLTRYIAQRQKDILKELKDIRDKDIFLEL